jgi:hypothetical protein
MNSLVPPPARIRRVVLILGIVCLLASFAGVIMVGAHKDKPQPAASANAVTAKTRIAEQFGKLPLSFEINKGQIDESVKFLSHGAGYDLFLTATEAVLKVQNRARREQTRTQPLPRMKTCAKVRLESHRSALVNQLME